MTSSLSIRERLLVACDQAYREARGKNRGSFRPDPSKRIAEGIGEGRDLIRSIAAEDAPKTYLAILRDRLEELRARRRSDPTSRDGDSDEDGYILGGLATVALLIDAEQKRIGVSRRRWPTWWRKLRNWKAGRSRS